MHNRGTGSKGAPLLVLFRRLRRWRQHSAPPRQCHQTWGVLGEGPASTGVLNAEARAAPLVSSEWHGVVGLTMCRNCRLAKAGRLILSGPVGCALKPKTLIVPLPNLTSCTPLWHASDWPVAAEGLRFGTNKRWSLAQPVTKQLLARPKVVLAFLPCTVGEVHPSNRRIV